MKKMVDGVLMDMTDEDIAQYEATQAEVEAQRPTAERSHRDGKLKETDWTQLADVPEAIRNAYTAYRQALRDVPEQEGFPNDIIWPTKPE
jgi:ethanolamine ammonia-lyase small subunit